MPHPQALEKAETIFIDSHHSVTTDVQRGSVLSTVVRTLMLGHNLYKPKLISGLEMTDICKLRMLYPSRFFFRYQSSMAKSEQVLVANLGCPCHRELSKTINSGFSDFFTYTRALQFLQVSHRAMECSSCDKGISSSVRSSGVGCIDGLKATSSQ